MVNHTHKEKTPTLKAPQNKQNLSEHKTRICSICLNKSIKFLKIFVEGANIFLLNAYGQDLYEISRIINKDKHTMHLQYHCQLTA